MLYIKLRRKVYYLKIFLEIRDKCFFLEKGVLKFCYGERIFIYWGKVLFDFFFFEVRIFFLRMLKGIYVLFVLYNVIVVFIYGLYSVLKKN